MFSRIQSLRFAFPQTARYPGTFCARTSYTRFAPRLLRRHTSSKGFTLPPPRQASRPSKSPKSSAQQRDKALERFESSISEAAGLVELFRAPSHRSYVFHAGALATLAFIYSGYHIYTHVILAPKDTSKIIKYGFGVLCVLTGYMGVIAFSRATSLVSGLTARRVEDQTRLYFKVRRLVPFMKQREIVASTSEISITRKLVVPPGQTSKKGWEEGLARLEKHRRTEATPFWKAPIKKTSYFFWKIFINFRRIFTQEHFVYMSIEGKAKELKLDMMGAEIGPEFALLSQKAAWK